MPIDWEYQEDRPGGVATQECLVSVAKAATIHESTVDVWPWEPSPTGEANREVIPSGWFSATESAPARTQRPPSWRAQAFVQDQPLISGNEKFPPVTHVTRATPI